MGGMLAASNTQAVINTLQCASFPRETAKRTQTSTGFDPRPDSDSVVPRHGHRYFPEPSEDDSPIGACPWPRHRGARARFPNGATSDRAWLLHASRFGGLGNWRLVVRATSAGLPKPPASFSDFAERYPDVVKAYEELGRRASLMLARSRPGRWRW